MNDIDRHRARIREMVRAIEDADAERALAMFRAYECALPVAEIARLATVGIDETWDTIRRYAADPDVPAYDELGRWLCD